MAENLEHQVISKLNHVLQQTSISIHHNQHSNLISLNFKNMTIGYWANPHRMFFKNGAQFNVFEAFRHDAEMSIDKTMLICYQLLSDLGLISLENCASWEEVLLKLNVMFPDV